MQPDGLIVFALARSPGGMSYAVVGPALWGPAELVEIDLETGLTTAIGPTGIDDELVTGFAIDDAGEFWLTTFPDDAAGDGRLYRLDGFAGTATLVGPTRAVFSLVAVGYALFGARETLWEIDRATGAATAVGPTGFGSYRASGLAYDGSGRLWGVANCDLGPPIGQPDALAMQIDPLTGDVEFFDPDVGIQAGLETLVLGGNATIAVPTLGTLPSIFLGALVAAFGVLLVRRGARLGDPKARRRF